MILLYASLQQVEVNQLLSKPIQPSNDHNYANTTHNRATLPAKEAQFQ